MVCLQWIERYPGARSYACPGLKQKEPEVPYTTELGGGGGDPPEWLGEVQSTWLSYERNPFNGKPFFNEVGHTVQGICFLTDLKCLCSPFAGNNLVACLKFPCMYYHYCTQSLASFPAKIASLWETLVSAC